MEERKCKMCQFYTQGTIANSSGVCSRRGVVVVLQEYSCSNWASASDHRVLNKNW